MLTTLVFAALVAQEPTVTLTHRCDRAEVVIAALGKELGRDMRVTGSVKDDYFLVRFDKTPVTKALERIAKTLNATWTKSGTTEYLTRLPAQERAEQNAETAAAKSAIASYAAEHTLPPLPNKDELTKILQASADARKRGVYDDAVRKAMRLNPDNLYQDAFFQMLDHDALTNLPIEGCSFMSLKPHEGAQIVPPAGREQLKRIADFATMYDDVVEVLNLQSSNGAQQGTLVNKDLPDSDEVFFGAIRDQFTLELFTFHTSASSSTSSSGRFIDLMGSADTDQDVPAAEGTFEMPFDQAVAQVFARPRSTAPTPETSGKLFQALHDSPENDPLSWLASEPILQAAKREGWDVVAVLPDPVGWDAWWLPQAPGRPLGEVLKQELLGWSVIEFDREAHYLSVRPSLASAFRRSRIDRGQLVKTLAKIEARDGYLEEISKFYSWRAQDESRHDLLSLIGRAFVGLGTNPFYREYEGDAMMLVGSMSPGELRSARENTGLTISAANASPGLREGLQRLMARSVTKRLQPKVEDGKVVGGLEPAILAFLTADPEKTTFACRVLHMGEAEGVLIDVTFPSGGVLRVTDEIHLPPKVS